MQPATPIRYLIAALLALGLASPVMATPMIAPASSFDGSEILIDFESIAADQEVTNQFADLTVSGGLFGDTIIGPSILGSTTSASNFVGASLPTFDVLDIAFTSPIERFRFDAATNAVDGLNVEVLSTDGLRTLLFFNTTFTPSSIAIEDLAGILAIQIQVIGPGNHALVLDNFEYASIPEASPAVLIGLGLVSLAAIRQPGPTFA